MTALEELKIALKEQKPTLGTQESMKLLKLGEAKTVFLAQNCPPSVRDDIKHYAELSGAKVVELDIPDDEVGILCKKRHSVSVLSF